MAFDAHKNFAYSTVLTAPSPASSGTSLVVQSADGTKFPAVPFNATVWPAGAQPTTANAEIVRVTAISTDTFTITRTQEGTSARTIVVGDQISATVTKKTIFDIEGGLNGSFDYVISGCVWSGDAYASTKAASMTAGSIWLNGVQLTVAAVTARTFTASKDTYVDFSDNGDGTAIPNYTEVTNNAASPALTAGRLRNGIIVTGASNIASAASINQGDPAATLPVASNVTYAVTDSLGNLICSRDSAHRTIGYRQYGTQQTAITTEIALTGISAPVIVPTGGRNLKFTLTGEHFSTVAGDFYTLKIKEDGTLITGMATQGPYTTASGQQQFTFCPGISFRTAGAHTYTATLTRASGTGSVSTFVSNQPVKLLVELA